MFTEPHNVTFTPLYANSILGDLKQLAEDSIAKVQALPNIDPKVIASVIALAGKVLADVASKNVLAAITDGLALFQLVMSIFKDNPVPTPPAA